jgi:glycosyltransferase involved in cell wall biosynthesis
MKPHRPGSPEEMLAEARISFNAGEYGQAIATLRAGDPRWLESDESSRLARDCYSRMGEISLALGEVNRMRRHAHDFTLDLQARFLLGRLIETDPTWLPPPTESEAIDPEKGVVLHLLKESLPYSESGYTHRSRLTLAAQAAAGYEPVVITSIGFPRYKGVTQFEQVEEVDDIRHYRLDSPDLATDADRGTLPYDTLLTDQVRMAEEIARLERPAIIHAASGFRGYDQALVGLSLARSLGGEIPLVYEVRGFFEATWSAEPRWGEKGEYYRRRWAQETRCLTEADRVITIADAMRDDIANRGIDAERIHVIPNVVDIDRFAPRSRREDLLRRLGFGDRPVIGYISNLGRREGIEHLLRATRLLIDRGIDIACLVAGEGPERGRLTQLVTALGIDDAVLITGHVPNNEIEDYYALIDVFVVPRIDDRAARLVTPLKPLEAMAMGVPLAVSDLPALREIAEPGVRGMTFPPADPVSMAETLQTMIEDEGLRSRLANSARQWVIAERSLASNADRYRKALAGLA